jgi:hypothetical protein
MSQTNLIHILRHILLLHFNVIFPFSSVLMDLSFQFSLRDFCISSLFHICYMPSPSHSLLLESPNSVWWEANIMKLLISPCLFLQPPVTSSLLGPNIPLSYLIWDIFTLRPLLFKFRTHAKQEVNLWLFMFLSLVVTIPDEKQNILSRIIESILGI